MATTREILQRMRNKALDRMEAIAKTELEGTPLSPAQQKLYDADRDLVNAIDEDLSAPAAPAPPTDSRERFVHQAASAILLRTYGEVDKETAQAGREFAGLSLIELARECLRRAGANLAGVPREQLARVALLSGHGGEHLAGMHSTSDLPNIVANVANKSLRRGYTASPRTFTRFGRRTSAANFKPLTRVQISDIGPLRKVGEGGEYKRRPIADSKETYALETYGDIVAITRKTIINDDLNALTRVPEAFGVAAASMESDLVWGLITANGVMTEDGKEFFHLDHGNLHYENPFDDDGLSLVRKGMRTRTAPQGTFLNLVPRFILAPTALEDEVERLTNPLSLTPAAADDVVPTWVRSLQPVIEPRLDADSESSWYMVADPALIDGLEYCYIEGQDGVQIEVRPGFNVDGLEIKAFEDFAAGIVDYRGFSKSVTAAAP